jgi:tetratricopeptide (TPR) repeat protein
MAKLVVALLQLLFASVVLAQAQGPIGGTPPAEELPPDWRAYVEAARVAEPEERLRRLEDVVAAHPDTPGMLASRQAILETTAQHWPDRTEEIMKLARSFVGAAPPSARVFAADAAAQALLDAGVLLSEAEKLSLAVLADLGGAGSEEPDELTRRGAPYVATLGRILAAQGRAEEAEKLLKQAWATNQKVVVAALALAELAESQGDDDAALGYLMAARLTGRDPGKTAPPLEALYRRLHGGSLEGLEETLDVEYGKRYPNPIETSRWPAADGPTGRAVLLEVFTGTGCAPCIAMNLSVEAAMRRFGRENLSIVSFHRHIPVVDPFSNAMAEARAAEYDLVTIPAVAVDGRVIRGGGMKDDTSRYWSYLSKAIEERLARPPEAEIALDAVRDGSKIDVRLAARLSGGTGRRLQLGVALVERTSYSGESGIRFHPAVARDLVVGDLPDDESPFRYIFDLRELTASLAQQREALEAQGITYPSVRDTINPERIRVVAFVQDPETRAVLESRAMRPREGAAAVEEADEAAAPER